MGQCSFEFGTYGSYEYKSALLPIENKKRNKSSAANEVRPTSLFWLWVGGLFISVCNAAGVFSTEPSMYPTLGVYWLGESQDRAVMAFLIRFARLSNSQRPCASTGSDVDGSGFLADG